MKNIILFISFIFSAQYLVAQSNNSSNITSIKVEMLFPEGKSKALILSFDDGIVSDRRLVKLMNDYGLKGTFHLNSNKLDTKGYLTKEEIKSLFINHEVSVHSANHPNLTALSKMDIIYEVVEDRKELERLLENLLEAWHTLLETMTIRW
jgi:peptidoglycan/xylan/chitin deacetylase (PgdA/CDA1 family)